MAQSPSHRFGQIIGDTLEAAIRPILQTIASELGMYLDAKGERKVRGAKRKVAWVDGRGNTHDLDYVFEADGDAETIGSPRAFIEIAWRRYTKHSRNKAQEIQGAILPLAERYSDHHPFLGVITWRRIHRRFPQPTPFARILGPVFSLQECDRGIRDSWLRCGFR
jgi:hypothetical protein